MDYNNNALINLANQLNLNDMPALFEKYEINTLNRAAGFLAQCSHESNNFRILEENLNYSADALIKVFPKYFKSLDEAKLYARNPEKIANKVYANRMGNGDEASGDGFKYRGRGFIQLTGKNNYQMFAETLKLSLDETINYCTTKNGAIESALFYWMRNDINKICDKDDIKAMTKAINGGFNGLEDRATKYMQYKKILSNNNIL